MKALRLSTEFMELYKGGEFTLETISKSGISWEDVFEQVPVRITNSHLVRAWLHTMPANLKQPADQALRPDQPEPFLEKNFECMIESIEQLSQESSRFQYHQRALARQIAQQTTFLQKRKQENEVRKRQGLTLEDDVANNPLFKPLTEPPRFESLLISSQIGNYTNEIANFCGQSFNNHFLLRSLQQETE